MIQIWSCASTETPMVWPRIQWLGSGLGHSGSTSKRGAIAVAACTTLFFCSRTDAPPKASNTSTNATPITRFRRFIARTSQWVAYYYMRDRMSLPSIYPNGVLDGKLAPMNADEHGSMYLVSIGS